MMFSNKANTVDTTPAKSCSEVEINSKDLLGSNKRIKIRHEGQLYELRLTRLGKLILTK